MIVLNTALLTLLSAAQAPPSPAPKAAPPATACPQPSVPLSSPLDRVLRDYEAAWEKGDEKALAALFSEDGFVMAMGGLPVRGRAAIEQHYATSGGSTLSLRAIAFATEGSTGFILGCYATKAGEADIGKFTLTLKKDSTGRWFIFSDMDNPNRQSRRP
jgi:ketosteroid isomerase-like protein